MGAVAAIALLVSPHTCHVQSVSTRQVRGLSYLQYSSICMSSSQDEMLPVCTATSQQLQISPVLFVPTAFPDHCPKDSMCFGYKRHHQACKRVHCIDSNMAYKWRQTLISFSAYASSFLRPPAKTTGQTWVCIWMYADDARTSSASVCPL